MSLSAKLQLGDNSNGLYEKEYLVKECSYRLSKYKPRESESSRLRGGEIEVVVRATDDLTLQEWYIDAENKNGRLLVNFSDPKVAEGVREIKFEDAKCYYVSEKYDIHENLLRLLRIKIVASRFVLDDVEFNQNF